VGVGKSMQLYYPWAIKWTNLEIGKKRIG